MVACSQAWDLSAYVLPTQEKMICISDFALSEQCCDVNTRIYL